MSKIQHLARIPLIVIFSMLWIQASVAQTSYYVDPAFAGGSNNGSAAHPWTDVSSGWTTINSALGSGPVTVYFSATASTTNSITITRTNTSTNVLTLDGLSQKNTNESAGSWTTSSTPVACDPRTGESGQSTTCVWYTAPKFTVKGQYPLASNGNPSNCIGYVTVQGFKLNRTEGQIANLTYIHDLTFQYNEAFASSAGTLGPGVYVGPANSGPCGAGGVPGGPDNVTVQYNYIHDTFEDCIYDGASTPDPPGYPASEYAGLKLVCTTQCNTGQNHLIQYNIIGPCSNAAPSPSGENVAINVKDGHLNHQIIGNIIRPTYGGTFSPTVLGPGINLESCGVVEGNYIEFPATSGIAPQLGWNTAVGRAGCMIANNIVVNVNSGVGRNSGIVVFGPNSGANQLWQSMTIDNNTVFNAGVTSGDACIDIDSGTMPGGAASLENNISSNCGGPNISADSGLVKLHDYNDCYNTSSCLSGEKNGSTSNPQFVSTGTPYQDVNFELQSSSPVLGAGATLASLFTTDYFGDSRTVPWAMGAIGGTAGGAPNPPTGLIVSVQ